MENRKQEGSSQLQVKGYTRSGGRLTKAQYLGRAWPITIATERRGWPARGLEVERKRERRGLLMLAVMMLFVVCTEFLLSTDKVSFIDIKE